MRYLGETAALTTAVCWSATTLMFSYAVQRMGAVALNLLRTTLAMALLLALCLMQRGPGRLMDAPWISLAILAASGWIGLTAGDCAYLSSLHLLGPRLASLLTALVPPLTATLGLIFLGENPGWTGLAGMALTLSGIAWVVLERKEGESPRGHRIRGAALGSVAALTQAVGLILTKEGLKGGISPLPATAVRMTAGAAGLWAFALATGRANGLRRVRTDRKLVATVLVASLIGPVAGIWLSVVAVQRAQAGIAATLMATMPVLVLPLVMVVGKERVSARAALGAMIAVAGVAVLFLRH